MAHSDLCIACRRVFCSYREYSEPWIPHHTGYDTFVASVRAGCVLCNWMSFQVPPLKPTDDQKGEPMDEDFETLSDFYVNLVDERKGGTVRFRVRCSWAASFEIEVYVVPDVGESSDPNVILAPGRKLIPVRDSSLIDHMPLDNSVAKIKRWLEDCGTGHEYCTVSSHPPFFPTRVIDVRNISNGTVALRDKDEIMNSYVVERDSAGVQEWPPKYWTLSHRWGDPTIIAQLFKGNEEKRTRSNEQQFRDGVHIQWFSPTFRDAFQLVNELGYRYIWIDSLCIFQDLPSDWKHEANLMKDVYGSSFCNISAVKSSFDSSFSLFGTRLIEPQSLHPFSVDMQLRVHRYLRFARWNFWYNNLWTNEINGSPLSTRGWVVQERFLARRVIHFTRSQMYWECLDQNRCEADPEGQLNLLNPGSSRITRERTRGHKDTLRMILRRYLTQLRGTDPNYEEETRTGLNPDKCWRFMVEQYTNCDLTKETDRLIAFSGVAKRFQEIKNNGSIYLAGLWSQSLHTDLMWESSASRGTATRRSEVYAPTWSWASICGGRVKMHISNPRASGEPQSLIRLVEARIEPEGSGGDVMGLIRSAELDIECHLRFFRTCREGGWLDIFSDAAMSTSEGSLESSSGPLLDTQELMQKYKQGLALEGAWIPVHSEYVSNGGSIVRCLLLEKVPGSEHKYKRLGKVSYNGIGGGWDPEGNDRITLV